MKKLIFVPLFLSVSTSILAGPEIVDSSDGKAIAGTIKDIEVKEMLQATKEFKECRDMNPYNGKDKNAQIKDATKCFQDKLKSKSKNGDELKKLSEALNLQNYGLVKSNEVKEIQNYLDDKLYEIMTGVNRKEQDRKKLLESMKFANKKHIDQRTFIELYKAQLNKNALFEISRFCFEDLRLDKIETGATFGEYWSGRTIGNLTVSDVTDTGKPVFGTINDPKDKDKIYKDLFESMKIGGKEFPTSSLNDFFLKCGNLMGALCDEFKKDSDVTDTTRSDVDAGKTTAKKGASACLARSRIQEIKKGLAASALIEKEFDKMTPTDFENALLKGQPIKVFSPANGDPSIDTLTNHTSADILDGPKSTNAELDQRSEECLNSPNDIKACEGFVSDGESFEKAKHNIDMEMALKREVEIARVKQLKDANEKELKEYLEQNGYFELLKKIEQPGYKLSDTDIQEFISKEFEAKKVATLSEINKKMGRRQTTKDASGKETVSANDMQAVVKETKEEKARLAQVVLFNNIITSHLTLQRKDANGKLNPVGRNVNAWKKEEEGLKKAQVQTSLFANLKSADGDQNTNGISGNEQIGGEELIDSILGKPTNP